MEIRCPQISAFVAYCSLSVQSHDYTRWTTAPRRLQKPNSARSAMARSIGSTDSTMQHNHNADALANVMSQGAARRLARLAGWVALLGTPFVAGDDACASAQIARDPHIKFAHGGRADFRGKDGQLYCFLSAPGLAVNVKTEDAAFTLHHGRLRVDGSFITEVHLAAIVGGSKRKQVRRADCRLLEGVASALTRASPCRDVHRPSQRTGPQSSTPLTPAGDS